jgi:hypothetical protein
VPALRQCQLPRNGRLSSLDSVLADCSGSHFSLTQRLLPAQGLSLLRRRLLAAQGLASLASLRLRLPAQGLPAQGLSARLRRRLGAQGLPPAQGEADLAGASAASATGATGTVNRVIASADTSEPRLLRVRFMNHLLQK